MSNTVNHWLKSKVPYDVYCVFQSRQKWHNFIVHFICVKAEKTLAEITLSDVTSSSPNLVSAPPTEASEWLINSSMQTIFFCLFVAGGCNHAAMDLNAIFHLFNCYWINGFFGLQMNNFQCINGHKLEPLLALSCHHNTWTWCLCPNRRLLSPNSPQCRHLA